MTAPTFVTSNPVTVGESTIEDEMADLDGNNERLATTFGNSHEFRGAGYRGGRHLSIHRYRGSGTQSSGAAESTLLSQSLADFAVGMWQVYVFQNHATNPVVGTWRISTADPDFTEYVKNTQSHNFSDFDYRDYSTSAPTAPYVKVTWVSSTTTITIDAKPSGSVDTPWAYAIVRISQ